MNRRSKRRLDVAVAGVIACAACAAHAGPTSEWSSIGQFQSTFSSQGFDGTGLGNAAGLAANFDSSSASGGGAPTSASALTLDAQVAAATAQATSAVSAERRHVLSATPSNTAPVVGSPAALDLTLWNFISSIRAQQAGNPFVTLQTSAANIDYTINAVPAPVPLPPALWLFLVGLAAFACVRLVPRSRARAACAISSVAPA